MPQTLVTRWRALSRTMMVAALAGLLTTAGAVAAPASGGIITGHAVINEIVADPLTGSAWVEVYDPTSGASVCGIEDDEGNATSGCGTMTSDFMIYVIDPDFLDDGGDTITLRGTTGDLDTVTYPPLGRGESYARTFDGGTEWEIRPASDVTRTASNGAAPEDDDPAVALTTPADGAILSDGTPTLAWTTAIDPGFTVVRTELMLSTSPDFTATPVTYTVRAGDSFTLPEPFGASADATWYWKVVLTFYRAATSADETVESPIWAFTVDRAETRPRFEVNGDDLGTYAYTRPDDTTVHPLDTCTLTFETFDLGAGTAEIDIISTATPADHATSRPLVSGQVITSNHALAGSNGTWRFDLTEHADTAIAGPDGYTLLVAILTDNRRNMEVITSFALPLTCLDDDEPAPTGSPIDPDTPASTRSGAGPGADSEQPSELLPATGAHSGLTGLFAGGLLLMIIGVTGCARYRRIHL